MKAKQKHPIKDFLTDAVRKGIFPGAVLLAAHRGRVLIHEKAGSRILNPYRAPMEPDTLFDLASLTKPLGTTLAIMKLVDEGLLDIDLLLGNLMGKTLPIDKHDITIRYLLNHCGGFPDWKPFYLQISNGIHEKRKAFIRKQLLNTPLACPPGKKCIYSDLGFILLEWVVEKTARMGLPEFLNQHFLKPLSLEKSIFFDGQGTKPHKNRFAATEYCGFRKRMLQGEVHDENAAAMGGYSGHAGLFGTAMGIFQLANILREHYFGIRNDFLKPETLRRFFGRQTTVIDSTWALGWDTPSPQNSSAGQYFSKNSVGHLGFTGTSIWMDLTQDIMVIFLTNRVHPSRNNTAIRAFRPLLHDRVMEHLNIIAER